MSWSKFLLMSTCYNDNMVNKDNLLCHFEDVAQTLGEYAVPVLRVPILHQVLAKINYRIIRIYVSATRQD